MIYYERFLFESVQEILLNTVDLSLILFVDNVINIGIGPIFV